MPTRRFDISDLAPWIEVQFGPARGPGGQHVNKVSTRATVLFDFRACPQLSVAACARIAERLSSRLSRDGRLRVVAQKERSQSANRRRAEERLCELLAEALQTQPPRRPTRPSAGARRRRLDEKRRRGAVKRERQSRPSLND